MHLSCDTGLEGHVRTMGALSFAEDCRANVYFPTGSLFDNSGLRSLGKYGVPVDQRAWDAAQGYIGACRRRFREVSRFKCISKVSSGDVEATL